MRIWAKKIEDNHLIRDMVVENNEADTRTHKVFDAVEKVCDAFDLGKPIWLDKNVREFGEFARTRFYQDSFIDSIDFDYLEFQVIEED